MANCKSYQELSELEQVEFIGRLVVAVQTRETGFMAAQMLIEAAEAAGVYRRIKIGHQEVYDTCTTTNFS
jgi:hypothetical protein